ncbi:hypothetical protein [Geobacter sp.]|uniref:hypothetical protein n=1 Tax=Geobacter sp. TaxID=46610 RepID=UPI0027BA9433|nr:hypothetical protein [Geobacter sp.]
MRKLPIFLGIFIFSLLLSGESRAGKNEEAKKFIKKVFNDSYIIRGNNATTKNTLTIDRCKINFVYTINGTISEKQSCNMKDLNPDDINDGGGMITIGTVNGDRKVKVSTLPNLYWALSLSYDQSKYPAEKVMSSLRTVISNCK